MRGSHIGSSGRDRLEQQRDTSTALLGWAGLGTWVTGPHRHRGQRPALPGVRGDRAPLPPGVSVVQSLWKAAWCFLEKCACSPELQDSGSSVFTEEM